MKRLNLKAKLICATALALSLLAACKKVEPIQDSGSNKTDTIDYIIRWEWNDYPVGPDSRWVRMCADNPDFRSVILIPDSTDISIAWSSIFVVERWERIADSIEAWKEYSPKVKCEGSLYVNRNGGCHLSNDTTAVSEAVLGMRQREYERFQRLNLNVYLAPGRGYFER